MKTYGNANKANVYCTFINWVSSVLSNHRYYVHNIEELSEECISSEILNYSDALVIIMKNECDICINKKTAIKVADFIKENKEALYV